MAGDSTEEHLSMRRLERACRYVNNYWMPVNSGLVARIQQDLDAGEYSNDLSRLLRDVRTDCGLFFHFVRRLVEMLEDESSTTPLNPIELFDRAGLEQLKTILGEAQELNISGHTLGAGSAMQLARYEEAIVSASTAETLAENCEPVSYTHLTLPTMS